MGFLHGMGDKAGPGPRPDPGQPLEGMPAPGFSYDAPTQPIPPVIPAAALPGDDYDPTQPNQGPIAGIDLVTFAAVSRQLLDTPAAGHAELLGRYGHTQASWSAVNTAWIARLGHMPFLLPTYSAAYRSS
jgi:hypothetical protein